MTIPRSCNIEITNDCKLACTMCTHAGMTRPIGYMEPGIFESVVCSAAAAGISDVNLTTVGEPLLHPECGSYVEYCKQRGLRVVLYTSLQCSDTAQIDRIISAGIDVLKVSIEGIDKESYERIRKGANFGLLMRNLKRIAETRRSRQKHPRICIHTTVPPEGYTEHSFSRLWQQFSDEIEFSPLGNQGGRLEFSERVVLDGARRKPCRHVLDSISVTYNGDLSFCCVDFEADMLLGNIVSETIAEAWHSREFCRVRSMHKNRDFRDLSHCSVCSSTFSYMA